MKAGTEASYQVLLEAARSLLRAADIPALIDSILIRARKVVAAEACSILLPDPATGELVIHSAQGDAAPVLNATRIPRGAGIAGKAFTERRTINLSDLASNQDHYKRIDEKTGFVTRSMLTVPLLKGDQCLGVLQMLNPTGRDRFEESDEELIEGLSTLIVTALQRLEENKRLIREAREQEELRLAEEIQSSFLPPESQSLPFAQVESFSQPARQVGGDFCVVHAVGENRLLVGLGDVTGKGIPAALTMARATAKIQVLSSYLEEDLGEWVSRLNVNLANDLVAGRFIGATFLLIDAAAHEIEVCAAGQYGPLVGSLKEWNEPAVVPQLPLGVFPGFSYKSLRFPLVKGQQWLLYSDGIAEARNTAGHELGVEGFRAGLPCGQSAPVALNRAVDHWKSFTGTAPQHDDASFLLVQWRGHAPASTLEMECVTQSLCTGRRFIEAWAQYAGFDDITIGQIILAADEAVTNIHRYAYQGEGGTLRVDVRLEDGYLVVQLRDDGIPCDPAKIQGRALDDLRPGGLGSFLLNAIFDHVHYEPLAKGTILTLKKRLPTRADG